MIGAVVFDEDIMCRVCDVGRKIKGGDKIPSPYSLRKFVRQIICQYSIVE